MYKNFVCFKCLGILLVDTPKRSMNGNVYHYPFCYDKEKHKLHLDKKNKEENKEEK